MSESPILIIAVFAGALYLFKLWRDDMLAAAAGKPNPKALPGAVAAGPIALAIGAAGALVLVLVETAGEMALGVSAEQTDITGLFLLAMIGAGVLEEVIFRGYLVVQGKGRRMLVGSIIGFSLLFALLHYQYYIEIPDEGGWLDFQVSFNAKAAWSLLLLFVNSLWFYYMRFSKWNPGHSLLPCFAAHVSSNLGVFIVKLMQGHVTGLY
jgi:membrane protease YdiL (CAAX protease family)